jgi:hypothetical protein
MDMSMTLRAEKLLLVCLFDETEVERGVLADFCFQRYSSPTRDQKAEGEVHLAWLPG